jgi:UDP-hydrolysing UDP-N-acetyl-D-glucosamine 2-epimerase
LSSVRRIAVLTTGRQDYGLLRSLLLALHESPRFELLLLAGGMHSKERFGRTIRLIREDGLPITAELDFVAEPPDPVSDTSRAIRMVGEALRDFRPEALVLLGDRSETLAAGLAAALLAVPLVHIHGGEETQGAVDNVMRHALTKMSHLHLVSHPQHARRVEQMGEDPAAIRVVGSPGLDNASRSDLADRSELEELIGIPLQHPVILVTMHPTTLSGTGTEEVRAVAAAMEGFRATYVVTMPNADAGGVEICDFWSDWGLAHPKAAVVKALGDRSYWGLLRQVAALLGNSSSGILEAPACGIPAVNVGDRQKGRLRSALVIDVAARPDEIASGLERALARPAQGVFGESPWTPPDPVAPRIMEVLESWEVGADLGKVFRGLKWETEV